MRKYYAKVINSGHKMSKKRVRRVVCPGCFGTVIIVANQTRQKIICPQCNYEFKVKNEND